MAKRILLIDDDHRTRFFVGNKLTRLGYEFQSVENGTLGLQLIPKFLPHLVILDITMPDKDGYEVCREIQENSILPNVKIIMFSNNTNAEFHANGIEVGADVYLYKNRGLRVLIPAIERELKNIPDIYTPDWFREQFNGEVFSLTYGNKLLNVMQAHLDSEAIETFCFRLDGMSFYDFEDLNHKRAVMRFLDSMKRQCRIGDLLAECYEHMPHVKWPLP